MERHALCGAARWLLLPGVGALGGIVAGIVATALMNTELLFKPMLWRLAGWGLFFGLAPGFATAFTSKWWLAALIAPAVSFPLVEGVDWVLFARTELQSSEGFKTYLRDLMGPSFLQVGSALLTIPATLLYALRVRIHPTLVTPCLHLAVAAVAAGWGSQTDPPGYRYLLPYVAFCGCLALGQFAAIELALRISRKPEVRPSPT